MEAQFELFHDPDEGSYRFVVRAANGKELARSQDYESVADARAGIAALQRAVAIASVPEGDDEVKIESRNEIHMHYLKPPS